MGGWQRYQNKEMNHDILVAFGYGDGGGGPTREMLETGRRMEKGNPRHTEGAPGEFPHLLYRAFQAGERTAGGSTWTGEFYFEYHRGNVYVHGQE